MPKRQRATDAMQEYIQEGSQKKASKQTSKKTKKPESKKASKETITFRLDADVARSLRKVSGERRTDRIDPYKVQDIISDAIRLWIKKYGKS